MNDVTNQKRPTPRLMCETRKSNNNNDIATKYNSSSVIYCVRERV